MRQAVREPACGVGRAGPGMRSSHERAPGRRLDVRQRAARGRGVKVDYADGR